MEMNHKKGKNRKKHKKSNDNRSFDPRSPNREGNAEKPVLFQLGSIASYVVSDVRLTTDPEITSSRAASPSLPSLSPTSSGDIDEVSAKERISSLSFDSSRHHKELLSLSSKLFELQGSSDNTPSSQVSGVTHASVDPVLLSPSVQMMDREGSDQPDRNSSPTLERNLSSVSNESLFSLSIGDNAISRDELFSYRDFKSAEHLKSGELLSFCPSAHVPADSSDLGKSFDMEDKASGTLLSDSEEKSSNSNVSWRNLGECSNSDEAPSSTQSFTYPVTKTKKTKKKKAKKKTAQPQQQQKQKKRCSWLCCKNTGTCFSCCRWPSCHYNFSCCKRLKFCPCCCRWPKCFCSSCASLFCCHWSCCSSSSKKVIDDEMTRRSEDQNLQKESKTSHKWFCCFPYS